MKSSVVAHYVATVVLAVTPLFAGQGPAPKPAVPLDPIPAIIDAFNTYRIVGLGEGDHGNEQGHAIRLALVRDPRFAETVNDIVVEFGNARYQEIADRFVNGEDVPSIELRQIWQNTSQLRPVWDVPIFEEFLRVVRDVNASRPANQRLRILLGDPPIDWSHVETFADVFVQMREVGDRDTHPAKLIQREVITKGRRALVVYGDMHLTRTPASIRPGCQPGATIPCFPGSIIDQVESSSGTRAFSITTVTGADMRSLHVDVARWRVPSLAVLRGTALGATSYRAFLPPGPLVIGPDGKPQPESPAVSRPVQDIFDGVLYIGPPDTITYSRLSPTLCADAGYVQMRTARLALAPGAQGRSFCTP